MNSTMRINASEMSCPEKSSTNRFFLLSGLTCRVCPRWQKRAIPHDADAQVPMEVELWDAFTWKLPEPPSNYSDVLHTALVCPIRPVLVVFGINRRPRVPAPCARRALRGAPAHGSWRWRGSPPLVQWPKTTVWKTG